MIHVNKDKLVDLVNLGEIKWWSGKEPKEIEAHPIEPSRDKEGVRYYLPIVESGKSESHIGVEWSEPRDIYEIQIVYKDNQPLELLL